MVIVRNRGPRKEGRPQALGDAAGCGRSPARHFVLAYVAFAVCRRRFQRSRFPSRCPPAGVWQITLGDIVLAIGLFVLFFEILKSTRTGGNSVVDHALSMIVFVVCLILFLVWDPAATSIFFLIMVMALIDVIAGFSVTISAARRDYSD